MPWRWRTFSSKNITPKNRARLLLYSFSTQLENQTTMCRSCSKSNSEERVPIDDHIFVQSSTLLVAESSGLGDLRESLASECTPEWFTCHRTVECFKRIGHKWSVRMGKVYITSTHRTRVLTDPVSPWQTARVQRGKLAKMRQREMKSSIVWGQK